MKSDFQLKPRGGNRDRLCVCVYVIPNLSDFDPLFATLPVQGSNSKFLHNLLGQVEVDSRIT